MTEAVATPTVAEGKKRQFEPGMVVRVHHKITEANAKGEEKERIQIFEGLIIAARHGDEAGATITVRKISEGVGVEKIFPVHSPVVTNVEVVKEHAVRRARLNYVRDPKFKRKMKEKTKTKSS